MRLRSTPCLGSTQKLQRLPHSFQWAGYLENCLQWDNEMVIRTNCIDNIDNICLPFFKNTICHLTIVEITLVLFKRACF